MKMCAPKRDKRILPHVRSHRPAVAGPGGGVSPPQPRSCLARPGPLRPERHPHPHDPPTASQAVDRSDEFRCFFKSRRCLSRRLHRSVFTEITEDV